MEWLAEGVAIIYMGVLALLVTAIKSLINRKGKEHDQYQEMSPGHVGNPGIITDYMRLYHKFSVTDS
jgi:hypothetical protein